MRLLIVPPYFWAGQELMHAVVKRYIVKPFPFTGEKLRLGFESGIVAVRVTWDGLDEWLVMATEMGGCDSATLDAGEEWFVLFRCRPEHCFLKASLAAGIEVISEGSTILAPGSPDGCGAHCCWNDVDEPVLDLPNWIITDCWLRRRFARHQPRSSRGDN